MACSVRVATIAAPKSAVTEMISVPGEATRLPSAAAVSVTNAVVLALRTRMRILSPGKIRHPALRHRGDTFLEVLGRAQALLFFQLVLGRGLHAVGDAG